MLAYWQRSVSGLYFKFMEETIQVSEPAGHGGLQEPVFKGSLESLFSLMMLPEGPVEAISRLTGVFGFLTVLEIHNRFRWLRSEYTVQSWWWGDNCLDLPANETLATLILSLGAIASIALAFGYRGRIAPLIVALSVVYTSSLDINIAYPHSYFLLIWVCVALLFRRSPESATRRLIQLSLVACYGLSAVQKFLTPEFISGHSLAAISVGQSIQSWFAPILQHVSISPASWQALSILVASFELSLALGLCFKKTRTAAVCGIVLFQLTILATMDAYIALLHFMIFVCCLAFFDRLPKFKLPQTQKDHAESSVPDHASSPGTLYFACTALAVVCFLAFPLRIYFHPGALNKFSLLDRRPWTFCMFIQTERNYVTTISLRRANAAWEPIEPRGRMKYLSGDADLRALAHYIVRAAPPFDELRIESQYTVNLDRIDRKILTGKAVAPGKFEYQIDWSQTPAVK